METNSPKPVGSVPQDHSVPPPVNGVSTESRPALSRPEVDSLVLGSVAGATLGGFLFGWVGTVLVAYGAGTALRWYQRKRDTPVLADSVRQAVW